MNNELELRLECMKLAVAITPTLNIPIQDKITDNFNFILSKVTDNGKTTFDVLKGKRVEETMENVVGLMTIAEKFISGLKSESDDIPFPPVSTNEEEIKPSKKKVTQPKTEIKEDAV